MLRMWNFVRRCRGPERSENQRHARSVNWFSGFVVPLGAKKTVTNSRVHQLTAQLGSNSRGERSCPWPPLEALFRGNYQGKSITSPKCQRLLKNARPATKNARLLTRLLQVRILLRDLLFNRELMQIQLT